MDMKKDWSIEHVFCPDDVYEKVEGKQYGIVKKLQYSSKTTGLMRNVNVLLPNDYDENRKYPVVFFLHGIFCNEETMLIEEDYRIAEITQNCYELGLSRNMIIVFPNMYATSDPTLQPAFNPTALAPYDAISEDLIQDLIPFISTQISIMTDREHMAIFGFSYGGFEAMSIGLKHSEYFAYAGAISPSPGLIPGKDWAMEHKGHFTRENLRVQKGQYPLKLLMFCCGSRDSVVGKFPIEYHQVMVENGVDHVWYEIPDGDHNAITIRSGYFNFLVQMNNRMTNDVSDTCTE